jgi:hypothetical protein
MTRFGFATACRVFVFNTPTGVSFSQLAQGSYFRTLQEEREPEDSPSMMCV